VRRILPRQVVDQPRESIAALYVLSHELGSSLAEASCEYAGRVGKDRHSKAPAAKLDACDRVRSDFDEIEGEPTRLSFEILDTASRLEGSTYRDAVLPSWLESFRTSINWRLQTGRGEEAQRGTRLISQPSSYQGVEPTEFQRPLRPEHRKGTQRHFMRRPEGQEGSIFYRGTIDFPQAMEQRLQHSAERIKR